MPILMAKNEVDLKARNAMFFVIREKSPITKGKVIGHTVICKEKFQEVLCFLLKGKKVRLQKLK